MTTDRAGSAASQAKRLRCARCQRPASHCLCPLIPLLDNRTPVTVLQDPDEARHALNTARLAVLGLRRARLLTARHHPLESWRLDGRQPWLLFPGPGAISLADLAGQAARPGQPPIQLVVPDGTWKKARGLLRHNPDLAGLPSVALPEGLPGRYRIRKAPGDGALSTVEAIVHALNTLDAPQRFDALLAPFDALIDAQIAAMGETTYRSNYPGAAG